MPKSFQFTNSLKTKLSTLYQNDIKSNDYNYLDKNE